MIQSIVVARFIHAPYEGAGFIHAPYEGAGFIGQSNELDNYSAERKVTN
jgi:hypothetical protein